MIYSPGYQILSKIYESANSEVYRAIHKSDDHRVILKILKQDYPTPSELTRYKQEYELTKSLNLEGVIKAYHLEKYQNTLIIVLEDFGGQSLKIGLNNSCLLLKEFLKIAIKIVDSLGQLHSANIIHKDLNPANIVFNPETEQLKIIDLGISTRLTRENPTLKNPNILEGTLAYISPEQTGRMNRSLDYRTDFYSLGVTFYELLTGKLPFETEDYLELVYCHLAKTPLSPSEINPSIPPIISNLVLKLMAKNAEDRYQSAWGLKKDLETCLQQLKTTGNINYFALASQDISDRFQIPQKLYGRDKEREILLTSFNNIIEQSKIQNPKSKTEMILIAGYSGIGKSALVQEIYKPITEKQGYFISGKFDNFKQNIPYSAVVNVFQQLVKQILTEKETVIKTWKTKLLSALGNNGQVIIEIIPELELILGKQPSIEELGVNEAANRFNLVLQKFIQSCSDKDHPLVIFLDDLQWADSASLNLIKLMMTDQNLQSLLLIGAYRDNEVSASHPLILLLDELRQDQVIINQITLDNLSLNDVRQLIADTLKSDPEQVTYLAELIYHKTAGNPFFTKQFLTSLYLENLINFDYTQSKWQWDLLRIATQNITDNVVELMINELKLLPESTQIILELSACIGTNFDLHTLTIIEEKSAQDIFPDLVTAINSGLILPQSELNENLLIENYQFLHDRVQQAAYTLIPEDQKAKIHQRIGKLLLDKLSEIEKEEHLFDLVEHLNRGRELITELPERENLAILNLKAGIKAKNSTAYEAAKIYLEIGMELLSVNSWQNQYQLTLNLYLATAEIFYLTGDFERMENLAQLVIENAQNIFDKIYIYQLQIAVCTAKGNSLDAINVGKNALKQLGIDLPLNSNENQIRIILDQLELENREIEDLINLPIMTDLRAKAIIQIFWRLYSSIFQGMPELLPFISATMVSLSLEYGNAPISAFGYGIYGLVLCNFLGEVEKGYRFGKLALNLMDTYPENQYKPLILQTVVTCIKPRKESLRVTLPLLKDSLNIGLETGDFLTAGYGILIYLFTAFFTGIDLKTLQKELDIYERILIQLRQYSAKIYVDLIKQTINNLEENKQQPHYLVSNFYDENVMFSQHLEQGELTALAQAYTYKLILAYLFGNYSAALNYLTQTQSYLIAVSSIIFFPVYHFYAALTALVGAEGFRPNQPTEPINNERETLLKQVENHQNIVYQWAQTSPMNHLHKWHLIEAEKQRILGNKIEAIEHYDLAIKLAKENEFIQEEALANELLAQFYFDWDKEKIANLYLQEAYYAYTLWGATAKIKDLEQKYPQLLSFNTNNSLTTKRITPETSTSSNPGVNLDLVTLIKTSQAISREIVLGNLLETLIEILLENVGAQTCCFLLAQTPESKELEQFCVEICSTKQRPMPFPLMGEETDLILPKSILNYVIRTGESVVLDQAIALGNFVTDPYIQLRKSLSILCYPLFNQGQLIGMVYLENNLITGAFTKDRLEFLQLISGQAAIAITNAKLYAKIREREQQLQQFLEAIPVGVAVLNAKGKPYYANQKAKKLLGKGVDPTATMEEISAVYQCYMADTDSLYPNENLPIIRALQGESIAVENMEIRQENLSIPLAVWANPIYDNLGEVEYAIAAFQDISQRKQAEKVLSDYNRILEQQVEARTQELQKLNEELSRLANLDGLTQIPNRRRFDYYLTREWQRHLREQQFLALILIDIDYFKRYNDYYGHQGGDDCLIQVAQTIGQIPKRPTDLVARYGGEEFAVILPNTNPEGALIVAEEIKEAIALLQLPHAESEVSQYVTISLGVASLIPNQNLKIQDLISQADQALYTAKNQGRNQIFLSI